MSIKSLTAENAVIRTASVEVKALTISGKQVTLAVFRQLPSQELLDGLAALKGVPWGTINYCPDRNCGREYEHIHIVWQMGSRLFRATQLLNPRYTQQGSNLNAIYQELLAKKQGILRSLQTALYFAEDSEVVQKNGVEFLTCSFLNGRGYFNCFSDFQTFANYLAEQEERRRQEYERELGYWNEAQGHIKVKSCQDYCGQCARSKKPKPIFEQISLAKVREAWQRRSAWIESIFYKFEPSNSIAALDAEYCDIQRELEAAKDTLNAFLEHYSQQMATLQQLDQLFIAV